MPLTSASSIFCGNYSLDAQNDMLATAPFAPRMFLPPVSSPLSPRSANIHGRYPTSHMATSDSGKPGVKQDAPFAQRNIKKAPTPKADDLKEKRRNAFLRKVKDRREDNRFDARREDILRHDFLRRQRSWEAEQARSAPQVPLDIDEEEIDYDLPETSTQMQLSTQRSTAEDEIDDVLRKENEELEALLEYMPDYEDLQDTDGQTSDNLWSDDVDYDALFAEVINQSQGQPGATMAQSQQQSQQRPQMDDEAMDLT